MDFFTKMGLSCAATLGMRTSMSAQAWEAVCRRKRNPTGWGYLKPSAPRVCILCQGKHRPKELTILTAKALAANKEDGMGKLDVCDVCGEKKVLRSMRGLSACSACGHIVSAVGGKVSMIVKTAELLGNKDELAGLLGGVPADQPVPVNDGWEDINQALDDIAKAMGFNTDIASPDAIALAVAQTAAMLEKSISRQAELQAQIWTHGTDLEAVARAAGMEPKASADNVAQAVAALARLNDQHAELLRENEQLAFDLRLTQEECQYLKEQAGRVVPVEATLEVQDDTARDGLVAFALAVIRGQVSVVHHAQEARR